MDTVKVEPEDPAVATTEEGDPGGTHERGAGRLRMNAAIVVRRLGYLSMISGVAMLAFAWYQIWGTGLQQSKAQDRLEDELAGLLAEQQIVSAEPDVGGSEPTESADAEPSDEPEPAVPPAAPRDATTTATVVGSSGHPGPTKLVPRELLHFDDGAVVGRISIPAIDVEQLMVEGIEWDSLKLGPGHYPTTSLPGLSGNAAVAGHRTTWGAPFNRIDELKPGDRIGVQMAWGEFTYEVVAQGRDGSSGHQIVDPTDVWVLDDVGDDRLTLTSCHPEHSARQRIVVVARLIGEPASVEGST